MNQSDQLKFIESINKKGIELLKSKGHDYAGVDVLKNFKQMHQLISLLEVDTSKVEGVHMFYIILKIQRLCNLLFSNKVTKNESISDTLIDLRNYTDLLNCTLEEKNNENRTPKVGDVVIVEGYNQYYDNKPLKITRIDEDKWCYFTLLDEIDLNSDYNIDFNFNVNQITKYLN